MPGVVGLVGLMGFMTGCFWELKRPRTSKNNPRTSEKRKQSGLKQLFCKEKPKKL